jgi:hypothetical protein
MQLRIFSHSPQPVLLTCSEFRDVREMRGGGVGYTVSRVDLRPVSVKVGMIRQLDGAEQRFGAEEIHSSGVARN